MIFNQNTRIKSKRNLCKTVIFTLLIITFLSVPAYAVDLRGRVQVPTSYPPGWAPRPYANVVLIGFNQFNQPYFLASFNTGADGMYFFYNVYPGPYRVVVNNGPFVDIAVGNTASFDVVPIWITY